MLPNHSRRLYSRTADHINESLVVLIYHSSIRLPGLLPQDTQSSVPIIVVGARMEMHTLPVFEEEQVRLSTPTELILPRLS
jgi:hypothetical protein